ncbi:MAG: pyridoxal 5'-phosphate synthase glutaminase subunit PdxT [Clostridia bacterium]|jgi:5'-phosphate synthase pdxT subunit|nr:pyridoxal 5'-phosphate synthase glutaminase subunit PdxT [Clostridia bacterium]
MQGAFREHRMMLERCGVQSVEVRYPQDLDQLDGLILPGGESTTISRLLHERGLFGEIKTRIQDGLATFGTCAGMILLAKEVWGEAPGTLEAMDLVVRRNAYGRQVDSFEVDLEVPALGPEPLRAVFIRAPVVERVGDGVAVLASFKDRPVLVRQGRWLACTFHPELTPDLRVHRYFLRMVAGENRVAPDKPL